jgi:methionine synthase II (cobalamin-independent)
MSKFNKTKEKRTPTAVNEMGEKAYKLNAKEELVATCLTTFLQGSYYESENEIVNRIKKAASEVDEEFVAKLALYLRNDANMRSVTHLLAGELASRLSGKEYGSRFYKKISTRPDDMSEILAYYFSKGNKKIANAMKRGFRAKLESMDPYLIDKYKMSRKAISLVDLVNLTHPKPTQKNAEAYKRLIKGESLEGLYSTKIMEKALSKAGQIAKETGTSVVEAKAIAITEVLDGDAPIMNVLRNLRNIIETAPDQVDTAIKHLTNKEKVLKSRLLPFRFATAYEEIEKLKTTKSSITFESDKNSNVEKVLKALETALEYSVENIPALEGKTAVLIDHSSSVRGDGGGHSKVSAFSKTTTAMIGNLFGSMLTWSQRDVYMGLFGDRLIQVPINRKKGLLEFNKDSFNEGAKCGGGTENGLYIFLNECIKNNTRVDNLVIFSDMVIGDGGRGGWDASSHTGAYGSFQTLFKKFKAINPQCNTICVNIRQTSGKDVFDKSLNVLQIAGWSDKIFNIIEANCKGYSELIKEIEKIEI